MNSSPRKRTNQYGAPLGTADILFEINCMHLKTTVELMQKWPKQDLAYLTRNVPSDTLRIYMRDKSPSEMLQILQKLRNDENETIKLKTASELLQIMIEDDKQLIQEMKNAIPDAPKHLRTFLKTSVEEKEQSLAETERMLKRQKIKV